jgi:hypothetical protein
MKQSNLNISVNLSALKHEIIKTKKGNLAMIIPLELNHLEQNAKNNNVYFGLTAWASKDEDGIDSYGNSHSLKQSLPKEVNDKMTKDERYAMPFMGNAKPFGGGGGGSDANNSSGETKSEDDLPF